MIRENTVFILGAGAHCSYGFPDGNELKKLIVSAISNSISSSARDNDLKLMPTFGAANTQDVLRSRCQAFIEALGGAGQGSIDAFLNANKKQQGFDVIGKAGIAQALLLKEQKNQRIPDKNDDWLDYVFKVMIDGIDTEDAFLTQNKISFITFNYDRFLESWLFGKIKYSFGLEDENALKVLKKIPILHIYGQLGDFPQNNTTGTYWITASKGIRTIFETHDQIAIKNAHELLAQAHVICLLGFGYHKENINLLNLSKYVNECSGIVASSRFGITDVEWDRNMRHFSEKRKIRHSQHSYKRLDSLRNLPVF